MGLRRRGPVEPDAAEAASSVLRLAVLLQAGAAPRAAWEHLARAGDPRAVAVVAALADGASAETAIARGGGVWPHVAATWRVATEVGAPLADSLRAGAVALRDAAEAADDVRVALAEPAGTARLLLLLPVGGVLLGVALGFDTLTVLLSGPVGWVCTAVGIVLLVLAQRWTAMLVRRAQPPPVIPGLVAELVAIALSGGASIDRSRALVAATGEYDPAEVDDILRLSASAGVPAVELLRASAAHDRHVARTEGRLRAARLSSRLLGPLGVCTLPAFLALGVAPMLLSVFAATPLAWGG